MLVQALPLSLTGRFDCLLPEGVVDGLDTMVVACLTLAQAPAIPQGFDSESIRTLAALAGVIAVGAIILYLANRWRRNLAQRDDTGDQMGSFRELYERGELSQEEYQRIKDRLGQRLRNELQLPAPKKPENPPPPPSPPARPELPESTS